MAISKPAPNDYPIYYGTYINKVVSDDLIEALTDNFNSTKSFLQNLNEDKFNYRYTPEKWSLMEVLIHIMDTERIFAYRALRFARKDKTPVPGYDENEYAPESFASQRSKESVIAEFEALRKSTVELFKNFNDEQLSQFGNANNQNISVRAIGYVIAGHELHHLGVIKERYL